METHKVPFWETVRATYKGVWRFAGRLGSIPWIYGFTYFIIWEAFTFLIVSEVWVLLIAKVWVLSIVLALVIPIFIGLPLIVTTHRLAIINEEPDRNFFWK
tara:strand:+ start:122 stop:424 length:303 start_codon:yes stop_codon:yes gene_type:complete